MLTSTGTHRPHTAECSMRVVVLMLLFVPHLSANVTPLTAAPTRPPLPIQSLIESHCLECHDEDLSEAGLRLDTLSADYSNLATVDVWQNVLEKLETGQMPPKKKKEPRTPDSREESKRVAQVLGDWIRGELSHQGIQASIDHKRRSPDFGNHLDHDALFDGTHQGPAYSRPRLWRIAPQIYDQQIKNLSGARHATAIHQPFAVDESKGLIADYAAQHLADAATLQLLMMNCQALAEFQTTGILKREYDGRMRRRQETPEEYRAVLQSSPEQLDELLMSKAIGRAYLTALERLPSSDESKQSLSLLKRAISRAGVARGLQTTLMAIMLKPEAIYRMEVGLGEEDGHGRRRLSDMELAFAISYALTDRGPSHVNVRLSFEGAESGAAEERSLLDLARDGHLNSPSHIQRVVKHLLDTNDMSTADFTMFAEDHKIRNARVLRFFREFFGYHHAPRVFKDEKRIGIDSGFEAQRMVHDADQLVMHLFDQDRDVLKRLLTTKAYFVAYPGSDEKFEKDLNYIRYNYDDANYQFNKRYIERTEAAGRTPIPIEGPSTRTYVGFYNLDHEAWDYPTKQPFPLPQPHERAGILMHPAWLIAWSGNFHNDPIRRGKWIREHLLAGTVPDVPITVDAVVPEDPHRTLRERLTPTRAKECWRCHQKMNPLGLPFEVFDDFGRHRSREMLGELLTIFPERHKNAKSVPVETSGAITDSGEEALDGSVANPMELVERLASSTRVRQSFIRHAFRFWLGRNETFDDSPTLMAADRAYTQNGGSMKAMIASLVSSDSFLYRK